MPSRQSASFFSRRSFLRLSLGTAGLAAALPLLQACGPTTSPAAQATAPAAPTPAPQPTSVPAAQSTAAPAAASGQSAPALKTSGPLRVFFSHNFQAYKDAVAAFQKDFGVEVEFLIFTQPDVRTKLLASAAGGDVPDLTALNTPWVPELARIGQLEPLTNFIASRGASFDFPNDWPKSAIDSCTYKDAVYAVQLHRTCNLPFYNKKMLSAAGVSKMPETWDEFLDVATKIKSSSGVFGFAPNSDASYAMPWFLQNGVKQFDASTNTIPMDTPEAIEALQFQVDLIHKHEVAPVPVIGGQYEGPRQLFVANQAGMILTGPWDILPITQAGADLDWTTSAPLRAKQQVTYSAGLSLGIPKAAKNKEAAFEFIGRITSLPVELAATKEANMTMPRLSWAQHPDVTGNPVLDPFAKALPNAVEYFGDVGQVGSWTKITDLFSTAYQNAIFNQATPDDALKQFVSQANAELKS